MQRVSTDSYKGVRDFYPKDQFIQRYIFNTMSRICEQFGYEEYGASILEPSELYKSKTSDEIVNDQTYTFEDRGGRSVTLRPEMTPTVARMIAARKRELQFPLRWYSIPNVFRYERAQRGRLREHWQLNADIFGVAVIEADIEIISLSNAILKSFGATSNDFEIRINDRALLNTIFTSTNIADNERKDVMRLLDKRKKIKDFDEKLSEILSPNRAQKLISEIDGTASTSNLENLRSRLMELDINNIVIDTSIVRGFDYYTGIVFEIFDTNEENNRSMLGGGRYDNLMEIFGGEKIPTVGFGMGDVTMKNFLESHDLLPEYIPATELLLCVLEEGSTSHAMDLAQKLRSEDITVAVNYSHKRVGDQIRYADKLGIPFIVCIGEKEIANNMYTIKQLETGAEHTVSADKIAEHLFGSLG